MLNEFKKFILRGNVIDLAVGVVIGAAFNTVVQALVKDMITPIVTAVTGKVQFADLTFTIHHAGFLYGDFLNTAISFIIVAAVVFFLVVQPINKLNELAMRGKGPQEPDSKTCPYCLSDVPKDASRCKFCTSKLAKKPA